MDGESKNFLGIDWGASDVGIAIADSETKVALAFTTLPNDETLLQRIAELVAQQNISTIIIGIPSHVNRKEVEYEGEKLGELIRDALPNVVVEYQNEMFTTKLAEEHLKRLGIRHLSRYDDAEAARIILQEWLDRKGG